MGKVVSLDELLNIIKQTRDSLSDGHKKIVLCPGVFDVIHIGHKRHLEKAKTYGDILVVMITQDKYVNKPNRPIFNQDLRAELISEFSCVDYVAINRWLTNEDTVLMLKPDVLVRGNEYSSPDDIRVLGENAAALKVGSRIIFTNELTTSSTMIISRESYSESVREFLHSFNYSFDYIREYIEKINLLNILVLGEKFVDEYQYGNCVDGIFIEKKLEKYDGGSWAVGNHLSNFSQNVDVMYGQTIVKRSYIDEDYKLFDSYYIGEVNEVDPDFSAYDLVIVVDYGHGMFTKLFREDIKSKAKFLAINTKKRLYNSLRKYWDRKSGVYVCLNEDELRCAVHDKYDRYEDLNYIINKEFSGIEIIITTGYKGCVVGDTFGNMVIPSFATKLVDSVGAGDAFLSLSAPLICLDAPIEVAGFVGNIAGAITCSYPGNKYSVTKSELYRLMNVLIGKEDQWKPKS
jgi:cytidyltransferase-like protein